MSEDAFDLIESAMEGVAVVRCEPCGGAGETLEGACPRCGGSGTTTTSKLEVSDEAES